MLSWTTCHGTLCHAQCQPLLGWYLSIPVSPNLQFNHTCVAGAIDNEVCVWRVKDGSTARTKLPELITALQWKPRQKEGEAPVLLVGLVDGQLVLVEALRASVNLALEIQTTILEHLLKGEQVASGGTVMSRVRTPGRSTVNFHSPFPGAICCLAWSPSGSRFAVASVPSRVQIYSSSGREYTTSLEIKDIQVHILVHLCILKFILKFISVY